MSTDPTTLAQEVNPRLRGLFLKNLADFQTELGRIHAGYVPLMTNWPQRKELPGLVFRTMRRVQDLRIRGRELGVSFQEMHFSAATAGRPILDALCLAETPADVLQGTIVAVSEVLLGAIDDYFGRNDPLYDQPTVPVLTADREELATQIAWAKAGLAAIGSPAESAFVVKLRAQLAELPKLLREHNARSAEPLRESRRNGRLPIAQATLPEGFRHLEYGPAAMPPDNVYPDRERYHAINFLQEVQAADSCASMLFEAPDMPWDFYFDLSRHMWDESRHAMFGEKKLMALGSSAAQAGLSVKAYTMRQTLSPLDRYAALTTQEADAFPTKHVGLKDAVAHGDSVSAMAWSYDIADETQHVRYGARWLPVMIEKIREPRSLEQVRGDAENWRVTVLAEVYKPAATWRDRR